MWRAAPDEAGVVAELLIEFRDWWGREWPADERFESGVERLIADPATEFLLGARAAGEDPAGVCQLRFRYAVWHDAEDCWLEDLFVRDEARGSGLGRALAEVAVSRARERGCARVQLDANESNAAAVALYERLGFRSGLEGARSLSMGLALRQ